MWVRLVGGLYQMFSRASVKAARKVTKRCWPQKGQKSTNCAFADIAVLFQCAPPVFNKCRFLTGQPIFVSLQVLSWTWNVPRAEQEPSWKEDLRLRQTQRRGMMTSVWSDAEGRGKQQNAAPSLESSLGFAQDVCGHAGRLVPKEPQAITFWSWPAMTSSSSRRFCFEAACVIHMLWRPLMKTIKICHYCWRSSLIVPDWERSKFTLDFPLVLLLIS